MIFVKLDICANDCFENQLFMIVNSRDGLWFYIESGLPSKFYQITFQSTQFNFKFESLAYKKTSTLSPT